MELTFWNSIGATGTVALYEAYLSQYPAGTFAPLARAKIAELAALPSAPVAASRPSYDVAALDRTMWARTNANLRGGPTAGSDKLGLLRRGAEVAVTGRTLVEGSVWYRVGLSGDGSGFVFGDLLTEDNPTLARGLSPGDVFRDCGDTVVASGRSLPPGVFCGPELVVVPSGSFLMGSTDKGAGDNESPVHRVSIDYSFAVGRYEVTRGEFSRFVRETGRDVGGNCYYYDFDAGKWKQDESKNWRAPGFSQSENDPVVCVNWEDAKAYADWLSEKSGHDYRLLSEAEWEYVARAGTTTAFSTGKDRISTDEANFDGNYTYNGSSKGEYRKRTTLVGTFKPNGFGLYDVHGNVLEWVSDCYDDDAYETHGSYPEMVGTWHDSCDRVVRGGSWNYYPRYLRSAYRNRDSPTLRNNNVGFRVARTVFGP